MKIVDKLFRVLRIFGERGTSAQRDVNFGTGTARWSKVSELKPGVLIGIPDIKDGLDWDEIVSIKPVGRQEVWDIEVEGTHNFIGNDIFAHNTYANGGPAVQNLQNAGEDIKKMDFISASGNFVQPK